MRPRSDPEVAEWLAKADEDLRAARVLHGAGQALHSPTCFHCQQAAEKRLKALMVACEIAPPRSHDLESLLDALTPFAVATGLEAPAEQLSQYAVIPRYPGPTGPSRDDAEHALQAAETIRVAVDAAPWPNETLG